MPPKADYWKHLNVVGVVAYSLIAECQQPNVSLSALPKPGEKKRLRKGGNAVIGALKILALPLIVVSPIYAFFVIKSTSLPKLGGAGGG